MVALKNHIVHVRTKDHEQATCFQCKSSEFMFSARAEDVKAFGGCNIIDGIYGCFFVQCLSCKTAYLLNLSEFQLEF